MLLGLFRKVLFVFLVVLFTTRLCSGEKWDVVAVTEDLGEERKVLEITENHVASLW